MADRLQTAESVDPYDRLINAALAANDAITAVENAWEKPYLSQTVRELQEPRRELAAAVAALQTHLARNVSFRGDACEFHRFKGRERSDLARRYVMAAKEQVDGSETQVDDDAPVSFGTDPGAYVAAWVWVAKCDLPLKERYKAHIYYQTGDGPKHHLATRECLAFSEEEAAEILRAENWDDRLTCSGARIVFEWVPVPMTLFTFRVLDSDGDEVEAAFTRAGANAGDLRCQLEEMYPDDDVVLVGMEDPDDADGS